MITLPQEDKNRSLLRLFLEAAAQFHPVSAALARVYQTTHPSRFEQDIDQWREDVTAATNDHAERIATLEATYRPKLQLSEAALKLAVWLVETSPDGLETPITFEQVKAAFPETPGLDLQDAAAELGMYRLGSVSAALGHPVRTIRPTYDLFALFDPLVMGTSPQNDAVTLAWLSLELDSGHVPELEAKTGWPKRRLNPALALLLTLVDPGGVRKVIQPDYVTLGFSLTAHERVRFKQLVQSAQRDTPDQ